MTLTHDRTALADSIASSDHVRGNPDAPVTLIEYGEFECVHCGRAYHSVKRVLEEAAGDVRFVFRHFSRDDVHPFSERSALAAEAAGSQGRFWEMHDFLFERQHQLEYDDLARHAAELGLDVERFNREVVEREHLATVHGHLELGLESGVTETPTFFINGVKYLGSYDADALLAAVRGQLGG
jgi:protein-disulfide isomerase